MAAQVRNPSAREVEDQKFKPVSATIQFQAGSGTWEPVSKPSDKKDYMEMLG